MPPRTRGHLTVVGRGDRIQALVPVAGAARLTAEVVAAASAWVATTNALAAATGLSPCDTTELGSVTLRLMDAVYSLEASTVTMRPADPPA